MALARRSLDAKSSRVRQNSREMISPPPRSPFLRPPQRPQLPPAAPALQQRAFAAVTLAVLSLLAMVLIGNLQRAAVVLGVSLGVALLGLILAISAMSAARRAGSRRPRGALAGVLLCAIGLVLSGLALTAFLLFSAQIDQYNGCMNGANTVTEQQSCQTQLDNAINARVTSLGG
jgi:hypothetical protein